MKLQKLSPAISSNLAHTFKYTLLYKQQFYKQRSTKMVSNTLRLKFCYLKIVHVLHPRQHLKIIGQILKISKRTSV